MKKVFMLALGFIFVLHITAFAEINKSVGDNYTTIESSYQLCKNEPNDKSCTLSVKVYVMRAFAISWSEETRYLMLWDPKTNNQGDTVVFSKKNTPKIEIVKNGQSSYILLNKVQNFSDDSMWLTIKRDTLKETYMADNVYIVFPTISNGIRKFEISKEIVDEWKNVLSTDMKKLRTEMLNK